MFFQALRKRREKKGSTPLAACYRQRWNAMSTRSRCRPPCACDCALKKARQPASGSSSFSPSFERSLLHLHGSRVPFCCDGDLWACAAFDPLINSIQLDSTRCGGIFLKVCDCSTQTITYRSVESVRSATSKSTRLPSSQYLSFIFVETWDLREKV